jgi:penicillin-binding protein 2
MDKRLKKRFGKFHIDRYAILAVLFVLLSAALINRLYNLQIINGASYRTNFNLQMTKTRTIKSTRGNIYDRNGNVLASNELSYSLTLEDSGSYDTNRERALALNGEAYRISQILKENGDALSNDFHVVLDDSGNYSYNVEGTSLLRFKADVFGQAKTDDLTDEEKNASASDLIETLISEKYYGIVRTSDPYTKAELKSAGIPESLTRQDILNIVYVRYQLFTTQYRKYMPVTIATNLSGESVAALTEDKDSLTGIDIVEDSKRVYDSPEAFASLIGYTGKVSSEDLAQLKSSDSSYSSESVVGKSGIEKVEEQTLQGSNGQETVYVDRFGKVLKVDESSKIEPTAGGNVYLTIDKNLQIAAYKILEQRIAGILSSVIVNTAEVDNTGLSDTENVRIAITDVYNAIIENAVVDADHFTADDASATEQKIASVFAAKQAQVFADIRTQLTSDNPLPYNQLSDEMKEYESYIVNDMLTSKTGILDSSAIDKTDETYLAWTRDETISLKDYLTYAAGKNWVDISAFATDSTAYLDSAEIYLQLSEYIEKFLSTDASFSKILYKYLIKSGSISGSDIVNVLYDQGILDKTDGEYQSFEAGSISSYQMIINKINSLELTPAMLALDPCSGSVVITDPNSGEILACVTYPGYDNNRLANTMDVDYYNKLSNDESRPFYNKATQQKTAPGSTFKLVTTTAGLEEKVITRDTIFNCNGTFDLTETPLKCWLTTGHGDLNIIGGIQNSCNVFFSNVAYQLGINEEGVWSDSLSLSKLQQYAELYDLDKPSGIEIPEADPQVSDQYAIQSSIGQGTHAYTTTQLARYATTLANEGTSYNISLIDKETDANGNVTKEYSPSIESKVSISTDTWDVIHEGMRAVIEAKADFADFGVTVAGKTGTAQESKSRPSHALFICFAPYENPEIAMAVRIGNGYSSTNAVNTAKDILEYYFKLVDASEILTGTAKTGSGVTEQVD